MSAYREPSEAEECSECSQSSVRTGGDGRPYCDTHAEPMQLVPVHKANHAAQVEAAARNYMRAMYGDDWRRLVATGCYGNAARRLGALLEGE